MKPTLHTSPLELRESCHLVTMGAVDQIANVVKGKSCAGRMEGRVVAVGKSNAGKSTLLNYLMKRKLCQISKQPGKTRLIHCYYAEPIKKIFVDLPGYGFAKAARSDQNRWASFVEAYLDADGHIEKLLFIMDSRRVPTEDDLHALDFFFHAKTEVVFVLSKADQLKSQAERSSQKKKWDEFLKKHFSGETLPSIFWVSAVTGDGMKGLEKYLVGENK